MKRCLLGALGALVIAQAMAEQPAHWSYSGELGPDHWAEVDPGYSTCALGKMQSPIDITATEKADLPVIRFEYHAGPTTVINNGHTVQVSLPESGAISIDGASYPLVQFHFHTPSEEHIGGKAFPMVAHFVHQNAKGNLVVVAVLFKEGKENPALAEVLGEMPGENETRDIGSDFDPAAILPDERGYYAFMGSLTTPPCTEGVRWEVLKQPVNISSRQIAEFRKLYPMNARPITPLNGRTVKESRS